MFVAIYRVFPACGFLARFSIHLVLSRDQSFQYTEYLNRHTVRRSTVIHASMLGYNNHVGREVWPSRICVKLTRECKFEDKNYNTEKTSPSVTSVE